MVMLWDVARREPRFPLLGHKAVVAALAFSGDGEWIATASHDHTVRVWEVRTGREQVVLGQPSFGVAVAISPGGDYLASSCVFDDPVRLYRISGWAERMRMPGHTSGVERVAFHPHLPLLASGEVDGRIILRDALKGRLIRHWQAHQSYVGALVFSPDGLILASGGGGGSTGIALWHGETGAPLRSIASDVAVHSALAFDREGRRLASGDLNGTIRIRNVIDGSQIGPETRIEGQVHSLDFVDQRHLLAQAFAGKVWLIDTNGAEPPRSVDTPGGGNVLTIDPSRRRAIVAGAKGTLTSVSLPDLAVGPTAEIGLSGPTLKVIISPDGRLLASGGEDRQVVLSDAVTLQTLLRFPARIGRVKSLAFDSEGRRLAVSGIDSDVVVWDLARVRDELGRIGLDWDHPAPTEGVDVALKPHVEAVIPTVLATPIGPDEYVGAKELIQSGRTARQSGQRAEAIRDLETAVNRFRRLSRANLDNSDHSTYLAFALRLLGATFDFAGRRPEALAAIDEARVILEGKPALRAE